MKKRVAKKVLRRMAAGHLYRISTSDAAWKHPQYGQVICLEAIRAISRTVNQFADAMANTVKRACEAFSIHGGLLSDNAEPR